MALWVENFIVKTKDNTHTCKGYETYITTFGNNTHTTSMLVLFINHGLVTRNTYKSFFMNGKACLMKRITLKSTLNRKNMYKKYLATFSGCKHLSRKVSKT